MKIARAMIARTINTMCKVDWPLSFDFITSKVPALVVIETSVEY